MQEDRVRKIAKAFIDGTELGYTEGWSEEDTIKWVEEQTGEKDFYIYASGVEGGGYSNLEMHRTDDIIMQVDDHLLRFEASDDGYVYVYERIARLDF